MPDSLIQRLQRQLERVRIVHEEDLAAGYGQVYLPDALARKYPNAAADLAWQYVFPAPKCSLDPRSPGVIIWTRPQYSDLSKKQLTGLAYENM